MEISVSLLRSVGVLAVCAAYTTIAHAADISLGLRDGKSTVVIEGTIQKGDCDSLLNLIRKSGVKSVYLASPGGNLLEAMRIGRLVRALKLITTVPAKRGGELREQQAAQFGVKNPNENLMCASACFFVFVAGVYRNQDYYFGVPLLGIHRPYLSESDLKGQSSDRTMEAAVQTRAITENYLKEMSVRATYADQMFSIPKDQVYWIPKNQFDSDFAGLLPELQDWIDVRARAVLDNVRQTDTSKFPTDGVALGKMLVEILSDPDPDRRRAFVLHDLQDEAWAKFRGVGASSIFDMPQDPTGTNEKAQSFCGK